MDCRLIGSVALALVLCACTRPPTAVVVVVESDLRVPNELASVHVQVGGGACASDACARSFPLASEASLPLSFTVVPGNDPSGPIELSVRGLDAGGAERVTREVLTRFVPEHTRVLHVALTRSCLDHAACAASQTCIAGACTSAVIDPSTLPELVPGTELDGSTIADAGQGARDAAVDTGAADARDTGAADGDTAADAAAADVGTVDDGGPADTGTDARPRIALSCAALAPGSPSGAYMIDPDGMGGGPPFLDYCETEADGGGWTLIAKVDPMSSALGFAATPWVGAPGLAFGTADLEVGDALYTSYWALPVHELRIVVAPRDTPSATRSLVTAIVPATPSPLRMAMELGNHVTLDAPRASWLALVGASSDPGTPVCELAGAPVVIPDGMPSAPSVRVRVGYVWADGDCSRPGFWAGLGAAGRGCFPVADSAGGGRICGTGAQREDLPLQVWLFGR